MEEKWGIFANVQDDTALRDGAKILLISSNGSGQCWLFEGLSQNGKQIEKYVNLSKVSNFRPGLLSSKQVEKVIGYATKEEAALHCPK